MSLQLLRIRGRVRARESRAARRTFFLLQFVSCSCQTLTTAAVTSTTRGPCSVAIIAGVDSQLNLWEVQRVRERRSVAACSQARRVVRAEEGRGHTLCCGSASLQPADGLLGAHGLDPRELCGDGLGQWTWCEAALH